MGIILIEKGKLRSLDTPDEYPDEDKLQRLIEENPNVLPLKAAEKQLLTTIIREAGNDSGSADLILTDQDGNIYLIETKLQRNSTKREVIAQLIDYAASFRYGKSSEEFIADLKAYFKGQGKELENVFEGKYGEGSSARILERLKDNFEDGNFNLVVAMDKVEEDIEKMISFINTSRFRVFGYELESYQLSDEQRIIVPKIVGSEVEAEKASPSSQGRKTWNEHGFNEYLEKQPVEVQKLVNELFVFAKNNFSKVKYGTSSVPDFKITSTMLGINSYGVDNVLLQIRANGEIYTRSDFFFNEGKPSCTAAEHFYNEMKGELGDESFNKWMEGEYLPFAAWSHKTQRIKEILIEVVEMSKQTVQ